MAHWYDSEGSPRHFEGKNGAGTTLREARKLNLYPSVTTIGQVKAKFALTNWITEQAVLESMFDTTYEEWLGNKETTGLNSIAEQFGVDMDFIMEAAEADEAIGKAVEALFADLNKQYARAVMANSREKTMAKADEGTDIHDVLERYFHGETVKTVKKADLPMCEAVFNMIDEKVGPCSSFKTETRFCNTELGYAGMCDLHNEKWVIDYKTKDSVDDKTKGWPEQAEQLAAYAHGLGYPDARLANIFISREDPTQVVWYEHKDPWAWQRFKHTLMLWQVENKYGPYFDSLKESK